MLPPGRIAKLALVFAAPVTAAVLYLIVHGILHYDDALIARDSALLAGFLMVAWVAVNLTVKK